MASEIEIETSDKSEFMVILVILQRHIWRKDLVRYLTLGAQGRPLGKDTLSVGGRSGGGGGGGWMMTSLSRGSTSPSMPLSTSSGSSSSSRASSFLKGSRSLYVSRLSCLTRGCKRWRNSLISTRKCAYYSGPWCWVSFQSFKGLNTPSWHQKTCDWVVALRQLCLDHSNVSDAHQQPTIGLVCYGPKIH